MKFKRTKPDHEPWKRRPAPKAEPVEPEDHIEQVAARIEDILDPVARSLMQSMVKTCLIYGHRYSEYLYPGKVTCLGCGHERPSVEKPTAGSIGGP